MFYFFLFFLCFFLFFFTAASAKVPKVSGDEGGMKQHGNGREEGEKGEALQA